MIAPEPGGSNALGPVLGALPDVRLLPDGRVTWEVPDGLPAGYVWLTTTSHAGQAHWFRAAELPGLVVAQRLVPVGPLLELVSQMQGRSVQLDSDPKAVAYGVAAEKLGAFLSSLLGETTTGEGP